MNTVRALAFLCITMLAVGAFAQYPSSSQPQQPQGSMQPSQSQTQPSQTQPSQNPGTMQGQQSQQPSATHGASIDDQVQMLAQQLNLTPDQQTKIKSALEDQHTQAMSIIGDNSLQRADKIQKIHALREDTITKVRATLTSNDQKTKFDQMVQAQDQHTRQTEQQEQQQTPPKK